MCVPMCVLSTTADRVTCFVIVCLLCFLPFNLIISFFLVSFFALLHSCFLISSQVARFAQLEESDFGCVWNFLQGTRYRAQNAHGRKKVRIEVT